MEFDQFNERHVSPVKNNKSNLFRQKLKPIDSNLNKNDPVGGNSVISNDELIKISVEKLVNSPMLQNPEQPVRDTKNPARFKRSVMNVKVPIPHEKFKAVIVPILDVQEQQPEDFKSFQKNKPLHEFDCFDDDKKPEEWLLVCSEMNANAHAHTLTQNNYEYKWQPCKVLGYNTEDKKYQIKMLETNIKKDVVRLSLRFIKEDSEVFKRRIELCKQLRNQAESEQRLKNQIEMIPYEKVTAMSKPLKARIFNKVVESLPKVEINDHVEQFIKLKKELEKSQLDAQKQYLVEVEMKNPHNHSKYESQNIIIKNENDFVPDFGIIRLSKTQRQNDSQLLKLDDLSRTHIEKKVSSLCYDYLDEELLKLDSNKLPLPISITQFDTVLIENFQKIKQRLTQNWIYKINEELKKYYFEKTNKKKHDHNQFRMSLEDEESIESHILKINFFLNNQFRSQMKFLLDSGICFYCRQGSTRHVQYNQSLSITQMIEDRWVNKHSELELNDHLEIFRIQKPIEEVDAPLLKIYLVNSVNNESLLESKFVKQMCQQPDLITIKDSLMRYINQIKQLSEGVDQIDACEIKLQESKPKRLLSLFNSETDYKNMKTFKWFSTAQEQLSRIVEASIDELIENLMKQKEFDDILNIKDNDIYNFFKTFKESTHVDIIPGRESEINKEQQDKIAIKQQAKHSQQSAFKSDKIVRVKSNSELTLKRKKSKSDLDKEKREQDKLIWRDENCENPSAAFLKHEIEKYKMYIERVKQINSIVIDKNMFRIDISELDEKIKQKCNGMNEEISKYINETTDKEMSEVLHKLTSILDKLKNVPEVEDKLRELEMYLELHFSWEMLTYEARYENAKELLHVLEETGQDLVKDTQKKQFSIQGKQALINNQLSICRRTRIVIKEKLSRKLEEEIIQFEAKFRITRNKIDVIKLRNNYDEWEKTHEKINEYNDILINSANDSLILEDRCKFLEFEARMPPTKEIEKTKEEFMSYVELWRLVNDQNIHRGNCMDTVELRHMQKEQMDLKFKDIFTKSATIKKEFERNIEESPNEQLPILDVAEKFQTHLMDFNNKQLPLINFLGNEAIEAEHWEEIHTLTGLNVPEKAGEESIIQLKHVVDIDTEKYKLDLEEISTKAFKQHKLKKDMQQMEDQLKEKELLVIQKNGQNILKDISEVSQDLDEKIQRLQAMKNYPDINQSLKHDCNCMCDKIEKFSRVLDLWIKFQKCWTYLEPVFRSEDIKEQLKHESNKFEIWNRQWIDRMKETNSDRKVWVHIELDNLEDMFRLGNDTLEDIKHNMENQLNKKRSQFARFYYLSEEMLIEVLAKTKTPIDVQPFLPMFFESISQITLFDNKFTEIVSPAGEKLSFNKPIAPDDGEFKGNSEKWLKEIEIKMKKTIKEMMQDCFVSQRKSDSLLTWVESWPEMCVLCIEKFKWTFDTEASFRSLIDDTYAVENNIDKFKKDLESLLIASKTPCNPLLRNKQINLLLSKNYNIEINTYCMSNKINDEYEFQWKRQIRYYQDMSKETQIKISLNDQVLNYDQEYMGNNTRLVVTPITERCFMSLISTKFMMHCGSLEGASAVGKTETIKELTRVLAINFVSINCTPHIEHQTIAKFLQGVTSTGSWCCLEEFNRLNTNILSVISMQLTEILEGLKTKRNTITLFGMEGVRLVDLMYVNITINPGTCNPIPSNLQNIFRTFQIIIPDLTQIIEQRLFSHGFTHQKSLASNLKLSLQMIASQCSHQPQQNFGMTALEKVFRLVFSQKSTLHESEEVMCLKAMQVVVIPMLKNPDILLFKETLKDIFVGVTIPNSIQEDIRIKIQDKCTSSNIICNDQLMEKSQQFYEINKVTNGYIILGETAVGKGTLIKLMKDVLNVMSINPLQNPVQTTQINPNAQENKQLFGQFDTISNEHVMGVIPKILRNLCDMSQSNIDSISDPNITISSKTEQWLVLDGRINSSWAENLNSVLDGNRKLTMSSGDSLKIPDQIKLVFETENLSSASPCTVSRCGIILLDTANMGSQNYQTSKIVEMNTLFKSMELFGQDNEKLRGFSELIEYILKPTIAWTMQNTFISKNLNKTILFKNQFRLLFIFIREKQSQIENIDEKILKTEQSKLELEVRNIILYSCVWALGGMITQEERIKMNQFLNTLVKSKDDVNKIFKLELNDWIFDEKILQRMQVLEDYFDFALDISDYSKLIPWERTVAKTVLDVRINQHLIFVVTRETIRASYFQQLYSRQGEHVLITGPTSSGKTKIVVNEIQSICSNQENQKIQIPINFSVNTKVTDFQSHLKAWCTQRIKLGRKGPPENKNGIIQIEDVNMPLKDEQGTQSPLELIRQWMDYGGWQDIDSDDKNFNFQDKIQFSTVCNLENNSLTSKWMRHFAHLHQASYDIDSISKIFSTNYDYLMERKKFSHDVKQLKTKIVTATLHIQSDIKKMFKPTPICSYYLSSLNELNKVQSAFLLTDNEGIQNTTQMFKLWAHEVERVFMDKLSQSDVLRFQEILSQVIKADLSVNQDQINNKEFLQFGSFCPNPLLVEGKLEVVTQKYLELSDKSILYAHCAKELLELNKEHKQIHLNLQLFDQMLAKICIISRIMVLPKGHGVLVGNLGSGRNAILSLSALLNKLQRYELNIRSEGNFNQVANWHAYLQYIIQNTGVKEEPSMLRIIDSNIHDDTILAEINNLLSIGYVPNLFENCSIKIPENLLPLMKTEFKKEDILSKIQELERSKGIKTAPDNHKLWQLFIKNIQKKLHVFLIIPSGPIFLKCMRTQRAFVNNSSIVQFHSWNNKSIIQVSEFILKDVDFPADIKEKIATFLVEVHRSMHALCKRWESEQKRQWELFNKNFINFLQFFKNTQTKRRNQVQFTCDRYTMSVITLEKSESEVSRLEKQIESSTPVLLQSREIVATEKKKIDQTKEAYAKQERLVNDKKKICQSKTSEINLDTTNIDNEMGKIDPFIKECTVRIRKVDDKQLAELFNNSNPSPKMFDLMEIFLETWKVKVQKIIYEFDDISEKGIKRKVKSVFKTCKNIMRQYKLKDELCDFPKRDLKLNPEIMGVVIPKFKELNKEEIIKTNPALIIFQEFLNICTAYYEVDYKLEPARKDMKDKSTFLHEQELELVNLEEALNEIQQKIEILTNNIQVKESQLNEQEIQMELQKNRLERASKVTEGLKNDKNGWITMAKELEQKKLCVYGDILICSGIQAQLGPFSKAFRDTEIDNWKKLLKDQAIRQSDNVSLRSVLGDSSELNLWIKVDLPNDDHSIESAVMLQQCGDRFPLILDPQQIITPFLRKKIELLDNKKQVRNSYNNANYDIELKALKFAIKNGLTIIVELNHKHSRVQDCILQKKMIKKGNFQEILIENEEIEWNRDFYVYFTSAHPRPQLDRGLCHQVNVINFMITTNALAEMMRNKCIEVMEKKVQDNIINQEKDMNEQTIVKSRIESDILKELNGKEIELFDNQNLVTLLEESDKTNTLIRKLDQQNKASKKRQDEMKKIFEKLAEKLCLLQFVVSDFQVLNPCQCWSLEWQKEIFMLAIKKQVKDKEKIELEFKELLYENISITLFSCDRSLFGLIMTLRILEIDKIIDSKMIKFILSEGDWTSTPLPMPDVNKKVEKWFTPLLWTRLDELSNTVDIFVGFQQRLANNISVQDDIFSEWKGLGKTFPGLTDNLDKKEKKNIKETKELCMKLLLVKWIKPEYFNESLVIFLEKVNESKKFTEPVPLNLKNIYLLSKQYIPVIFVCEIGTDPIVEVSKFSKEFNLTDENFSKKSVGQGQDQQLDKSIMRSREKGQWIILQNCQNNPNFLYLLEERILETAIFMKSIENKKKKKEDADEEEEDEEQKIKIDPKFRFWFTCNTMQWPTQILHNSVKVSYEHVKNIKNNVIKLQNMIEKNYFNDLDEEKGGNIKKLIQSLSIFHSTLKQRKSFGSIGFNSDQNLTLNTFDVSKELIKQLILSQMDIPWNAILHIVVETNYMSNINDICDRNLISAHADDQLNTNIKDNNYKIKGQYKMPEMSSHTLEEWKQYVTTIETDPEKAELLGIHPNGEIIFKKSQSENIIQNALISSFQTSVPKVQDPIQIVSKQLARMPEDISLFDLNKLKPQDRDNSLNLVLMNECKRQNYQLNLIKSSLSNIIATYTGDCMINNKYEDISNSLFNNLIPQNILDVSQLTDNKYFSCYFDDLLKRLQYIRTWVQEQQPIVFWIGVFQNPHAFLTALILNYSRSFSLPIENVKWQFRFQEREPKERAPEGEQINGIQIEGARQSADTQELADCESGHLHYEMPQIEIIPKDINKKKTKKHSHSTPLYKTSIRKGVQNSLGVNSNLIMYVDVPTNEELESKYWIKKGIALFTMMNNDRDQSI